MWLNGGAHGQLAHAVALLRQTPWAAYHYHRMGLRMDSAHLNGTLRQHAPCSHKERANDQWELTYKDTKGGRMRVLDKRRRGRSMQTEGLSG